MINLKPQRPYKIGALSLLFVFFVMPDLLDDIAIAMRLMRGVTAYLVLQAWVKGGSISGRLTNPLHRWLRQAANGKAKAATEEFLRRLDLPD